MSKYPKILYFKDPECGGAEEHMYLHFSGSIVSLYRAARQVAYTEGKGEYDFLRLKMAVKEVEKLVNPEVTNA
jgi:hypothetical protein